MTFGPWLQSRPTGSWVSLWKQAKPFTLGFFFSSYSKYSSGIQRERILFFSETNRLIPKPKASNPLPPRRGCYPLAMWSSMFSKNSNNRNWGKAILAEPSITQLTSNKQHKQIFRFHLSFPEKSCPFPSAMPLRRSANPAHLFRAAEHLMSAWTARAGKELFDLFYFILFYFYFLFSGDDGISSYRSKFSLAASPLVTAQAACSAKRSIRGTFAWWWKTAKTYAP